MTKNVRRNQKETAAASRLVRFLVMTLAILIVMQYSIPTSMTYSFAGTEEAMEIAPIEIEMADEAEAEVQPEAETEAEAPEAAGTEIAEEAAELETAEEAGIAEEATEPEAAEIPAEPEAEPEAEAPAPETAQPAAPAKVSAPTVVASVSAVDKLNIHVTGIMYTRGYSENGKAVPYSTVQTIQAGSTKTLTATGVLNWVGGKNITANGAAGTYTFLNIYVLSAGTNDVVTGESAAEFNNVLKIQYKGNGQINVTMADGTIVPMEGTDIYISPAYKVQGVWYLDFRYIDRVSTGSGSWRNLDKVSSFTHTFKQPEGKPHYSFVTWMNENGTDTYNAGDKYTFSGEGMSPGETRNVKMYAIWQPSVTVRYNVNGVVADSVESFDRVVVADDLEDLDENTVFVGWFDADGNKVEAGTVIEAPETTGAEEEVIQPLTVDLYAVYETSHTVTKVWDDEDDKDGLRPESIEAELVMDGEKTGMTAVLSEENDWTYTFEGLKAFDGSREIAYTADENTEFDGNYSKSIATEDDTTVITNTLIPRITIKAADGSWTYDGTGHTADEVTIVEGSLFSTDRLEAEAEGTVKNTEDSAEDANKVASFRIVRGEGEDEIDVTDKYIVTTEDGSLEVTPAKISIVTESAHKAYDGKALTAGGSIKGLVDGETVEFTVTGSITEVGSAKNTYSLIWNGTAIGSNYEIENESIGTLTVGPAPVVPEDNNEPEQPRTEPENREEETAAGIVVPQDPTDGTTGTETPEVIEDNATPQSGAETEVIEDEAAPMVAGAGSWALLNLIAAILTGVGSIAAILRRREDEETESDEDRDARKRRMNAGKVFGIAIAVISVIAFILTEDMNLSMVLMDKWTIVMAVLFAGQIVAAGAVKKASKADEDEEENAEYANA